MKKIDAAKYFLGREKLNCAQAVARYYQKHYNLSPGIVQKFSRHGAGKAPGGVCGALYAAVNICENVPRVYKIKKTFMSQAGCMTCEGIKRAKQMNCSDCINLAASALISDDFDC